MLVEAPVLDRDRRLPQPRGDLVRGGVLVHGVGVHVAERCPVGREDLGRRIGVPGVELTQVRGRVRGGHDPADREQRRDRDRGHRQHHNHHHDSPDGVSVVAPAAALSIASAHRGRLRGGRCRCAGRLSRHRKRRTQCSWEAFSAFQYRVLHTPDPRHHRPNRERPRMPDSATPMRATATPPAAILLDALGTLVALEPPAPLLRSGARAPVRSRDLRARGGTGDRGRNRLLPGPSRRGPRSSSDLESLRRRCAGVLRSELPRQTSSSTRSLDALLASLRFTAFADVRPALEAARSRGQRLVVASNWDVSLHGVLRALELEPLLDGILTSAEAGARKPAPADLRTGACDCRRGSRTRRFTSVTASTRTSPALAAPGSTPC